ncbi:hypothetical protein CDAR_476351 [Caerostris darwini]|uniref:Uncharacterized protein n=1 Tax=Caerostris darwini TaxID=1538125 RepID=A0AAV4TNZ2_9ARAC|nr:hypothetical protein CDAR_476351 [Caerostris darwini]
MKGVVGNGLMYCGGGGQRVTHMGPMKCCSPKIKKLSKGSPVEMYRGPSGEVGIDSRGYEFQYGVSEDQTPGTKSKAFPLNQ